MLVTETERLFIRELDTVIDAEFIFLLLNSPKFIQYIGDRGVRSVEQASEFIENRYRQSYRDHGFGLYAVELKTDKTKVGLCGFVKRDHLEFPDIGFAFLPDHERKGYGFESAVAVIKYGRAMLGLTRILAITSPDNYASGNLLEKLGFTFDSLNDSGGDVVKLFFSGDVERR